MPALHNATFPKNKIGIIEIPLSLKISIAKAISWREVFNLAILDTGTLTLIFARYFLFKFFGLEFDLQKGNYESLNLSLALSKFTITRIFEIIFYGNDNILYENTAGNQYSVRRLLYVLSDIILFFEIITP